MTHADDRHARRDELGVHAPSTTGWPTSWSGSGSAGCTRPAACSYSVDFAEIEELQVAGQWDEAGELLAAEAGRAARRPARSCCCCAPTPCTRWPTRSRRPSAIPLLHLADTTAAAVRAAGLTTVGLLGTAFTMEQDFYRDRLAGHGLRVLVPDADDRAEVHRVIYDELCLGVVREQSRADLPAVIDRLVAAGRRRASSSAAPRSSC